MSQLVYSRYPDFSTATNSKILFGAVNTSQWVKLYLELKAEANEAVGEIKIKLAYHSASPSSSMVVKAYLVAASGSSFGDLVNSSGNSLTGANTPGPYGSYGLAWNGLSSEGAFLASGQVALDALGLSQAQSTIAATNWVDVTIPLRDANGDIFTAPLNSDYGIVLTTGATSQALDNTYLYIAASTTPPADTNNKDSVMYANMTARTSSGSTYAPYWQGYQTNQINFEIRDGAVAAGSGSGAGTGTAASTGNAQGSTGVIVKPAVFSKAKRFAKKLTVDPMGGAAKVVDSTGVEVVVPEGSVIKYNGKRYVKTGPGAAEFLEISATAKPDWKWSTEAEAVWASENDVLES